MKKTLFLSAGIAALFLQTASAQYPIGSVNGLESWENTLDGWVMNPGGQNNAYTYAFGTTTGVTDGSYCLALTGTDYPSYGQMLATPASTNLTAMLADAVSITLSVYVPAGAFNNIFNAFPEGEKFDRFLSVSEGISRLISKRDLEFSHDSTPTRPSTLSSGVSAVPPSHRNPGKYA